jgi:hypothetical protein
MKENEAIKKVLLVIAILWIVLPDPIPGPIDDIVIIFVTALMNKRKSIGFND